MVPQHIIMKRGTIWHRMVSPDLLTEGWQPGFLSGQRLGTPNPYNLSEKYCCTLPICTAVRAPFVTRVPCWLLSFEERETPQYTSNLYRSTPPICTGNIFEKVPVVGGSGKFLDSSR